MWMYVREGKAVGPDTSPHCGRVDILLNAPLEREALWLRLVSTEIDQVPSFILYMHVYHICRRTYKRST